MLRRNNVYVKGGIAVHPPKHSVPSKTHTHTHTHAWTHNSAVNFNAQCSSHTTRCRACDTRYQCIMPSNAKHTQIRPAINIVTVIHGQKPSPFKLEPRHITSFTCTLLHYVLEMAFFDTHVPFTHVKQLLSTV